MDDRTTGLVLRALRRRRAWRQSDLASKAGVSQSTVSRAERGWLEDLSLHTIRSLFTPLEARVPLAPRWKGAELERLIDEDHSAAVDAVARRIERLGWQALLEVTYAEFGERGSIDVLGLRAAARAIVVIEVKTDVASSEAIGRKLDEKARLAPAIVVRRHGWTPLHIGRVVVMPESMRLRRLVERHPVIGRMFPVDALAVRRWLRTPDGSYAGLWYLSDIGPQTGREAMTRPGHRIRAHPSVNGQAKSRSTPDYTPQRAAPPSSSPGATI